MNHVELFAGCGGLSLGLELAGFDLTMANELSPMAAETFAYNLLDEDLHSLSESKGVNSKALWLSTKFPDLKSRLRENPFEYPDLNAKDSVSDIPEDPNELKGKLVVGNIIHLNKLLEKDKSFRDSLRGGFGDGGVDLVSGGPPCQSFSLAGLRQRDSDKNALPWEFANFVEHVKPKFAVLENVTGILRAFNEGGKSYHAWFQVAQAFVLKGYIPLCLHLNARLAGVPQNRPRFIMLGVRHNVYQELKEGFNEAEESLFSPSFKFYKKVKAKVKVDLNDLPYFDVKKHEHLALYQESFLAPLVGSDEVSVKEAIDDLKFNNSSGKLPFVNILNDSFKEVLGSAKNPDNHEPRANNRLVQRRFRIYQALQQCNKTFVTKEVFSILKQEEEELSLESWRELRVFKFVAEKGVGEYIQFKTRAKLCEYLQRHPTKKQTQKALDPAFPAPAALSIPDDACHYDFNELRTLTVREMARIQSFPDSFTFRSKVTTGGKMRRFEVPQYTQVGNAVPPLLGLALGKVIAELISRVDNDG
ncbi:DNA (cytosine-5-)-methyltransferase [Pseudomonadales bacterium]|nr:DNA (cytosine-5-)-methyltransferase [Pseudomonadales bacterium]